MAAKLKTIRISSQDYQTLVDAMKYYGEPSPEKVLAHLINSSNYVKSIYEQVRYDRLSEIGR